MVGGEGFEPSKAEPTDLQSAVFDRFTIHPRNLLTLFVRPFDVLGAHLTSSSAHHLCSSKALAVMFVRSLPKSINNFWVICGQTFFLTIVERDPQPSERSALLNLVSAGEDERGRQSDRRVLVQLW